MRTPIERSWCRIESAASSSRISTASVISNSSRRGSSPEAASAPAIFSASVSHLSCTGETLTARRTWAVEVGAVLRRQRNADAGVGRELVAKAMIGPADRFVDTRHEGQHVGGRFDPGLDDGEFVAAEPRNQIARLEAGADAARDRLQQLV